MKYTMQVPQGAVKLESSDRRFAFCAMHLTGAGWYGAVPLEGAPIPPPAMDETRTAAETELGMGLKEFISTHPGEVAGVLQSFNAGKGDGVLQQVVEPARKTVDRLERQLEQQ